MVMQTIEVMEAGPSVGIPLCVHFEFLNSFTKRDDSRKPR